MGASIFFQKTEVDEIIDTQWVMEHDQSANKKVSDHNLSANEFLVRKMGMIHSTIALALQGTDQSDMCAEAITNILELITKTVQQFSHQSGLIPIRLWRFSAETHRYYIDRRKSGVGGIKNDPGNLVATWRHTGHLRKQLLRHCTAPDYTINTFSGLAMVSVVIMFQNKILQDDQFINNVWSPTGKVFDIVAVPKELRAEFTPDKIDDSKCKRPPCGMEILDIPDNRDKLDLLAFGLPLKCQLEHGNSKEPNHICRLGFLGEAIGELAWRILCYIDVEEGRQYAKLLINLSQMKAIDGVLYLPKDVAITIGAYIPNTIQDEFLQC
eukprot:714171_1